jgi:drug/metabolite transporter (DMT)-like permease
VSVVAVVGALVIVIGIWLLSRDGSREAALVKGKVALKGVVASLVTAAVWSVGVTLMDVVVTMPGVDSLGTNSALITVRIASMALLLLLLAPVLDRHRGFLKVSRKGIILLCVGGLVANALGWLVMNCSFLDILSAQAVPISSTTPLFGAFAGFLLFKEKATLSSILGAVVVVVGVVLIFMV